MSEKNQFEQLYQHNYQKVFGLCLGYVSGDRDLANDLTQEVFIKVWSNLKHFRKDSKITTWIYKITVNTCLQQLRTKKPVPLKIDVRANDNEEYLIKEKQFTLMYACINKLSKGNKSIILLDLEGLAQEEIAEVIGISYSAMRTRIHRIKDELSKCVKK